jgi:K+-transporting ATPase ATPase A chain
MFLQVWSLPLALFIVGVLVAIPLSKYMMWLMEGKYKPLPVFGWIEKRLDSGPQNWKQYVGSLLIFNTVLFVFGYLVLVLQPWLPLNPDGKGLLSPTAIFNSVISFMTNILESSIYQISARYSFVFQTCFYRLR